MLPSSSAEGGGRHAGKLGQSPPQVTLSGSFSSRWTQRHSDMRQLLADRTYVLLSLCLSAFVKVERSAQFGGVVPSRLPKVATTVRRALQELRLRGLIVTRQGKGAFVRMPAPVAITLTAENYRRHQREGRAGFEAQVREQGRLPRQEVLEVRTVPAPAELAERLASKQELTCSCDVCGSWSMSYRCSLSSSSTTQGSWPAASLNSPS
jgi:hypothetical protein